MKPPPFRYVRATSLAQAVETLAANPGAARVLAGGQSLMPMMNFRLLEPNVLVDINGLDALQGISEAPDHLRIGALTRHRETETSAIVARHFPVLAAAIRHVAHMSIRNRGTFGGSLSHADPAAELPMLAVLLDARIRIAAKGDERVVAARDFFIGALTTVLADGEIVTAIELPFLPLPAGWAFEEVAIRAGDYALAAVGVTVAEQAGKVSAARIGLAGVGQTPLRADAAEARLTGQPLTPETIAAVAATASAGCDPMSDLHASADYRRHLVEVLVRRCLTKARSRLREAQVSEGRI